MSDIKPPPNSLSSDDALPPVEPPSAGFLVQLFLIPGLIVAIIVVVWLLFHWLAQMGNDPREYVKKLRGNNEVRWQAAVNLAGVLHSSAGDELKKDSTVVADLGQILTDEITAANTDERSINLRVYLCRALGEFQVEAALSPLLVAATTQRSDAEMDVQRAAVQGLATLAANLNEAKPGWNHADLMATLLAVSKSDNDNLRTESAFALGIIDDPETTARLTQMLDDPHADARFNAATGLARRGDKAALPGLLEMLDADQRLATEGESPENRQEKTALVNIAGLQALAKLADQNSTIDLSQAQVLVERLTKSNIPDVRAAAVAVREKLARRQARPPAEEAKSTTATK
ncbi:MAG TPA: HEAT repeat domain-containing protein [Pirellulales bacterium]|jgi:HEAT repeat protein|nr:HEAT repeat domain-containing protein [Pirellulales bacterium]